MAERSAENLLILGVVAGGLYLAYQLVKGLKAAGQDVVDAATAAGQAIYHGAQAVTAPVANVIAAAVLKLYPLPPAMGGVPGNVLFPDGYAAPLSTYQIFGDDPNHPTAWFVKDRGSTYQLGQSDADGDWPATYVSG